MIFSDIVRYMNSITVQSSNLSCSILISMTTDVIKCKGHKKKLLSHGAMVPCVAGPVEYTSKTFVEKNRDALGADLVKCMKNSSKAHQKGFMTFLWVCFNLKMP